MSKKFEIYQNYVKTFENVIQPVVSEKGVMPENLEGETWTRPNGKETMSHKWGDREYGPVTVEISNMGRVREIQSVNRGWTFIVAVHATKDDYYNFRKPMGMFHYFNT